MKINPFILSLYALTVLRSCTKSFINSSRGDTYLMTVKEYKTNIPLAGVKISLYRCTDYDNIFGCQSKSVFETRSTDHNGEYIFTSREFSQTDQGIILSKLEYRDIGVVKDNVCSFNMLNQINHLKTLLYEKNNTYTQLYCSSLYT